jgi:hypothetical protein
MVLSVSSAWLGVPASHHPDKGSNVSAVSSFFLLLEKGWQK